jgi:hypothetical protein
MTAFYVLFSFLVKEDVRSNRLSKYKLISRHVEDDDGQFMSTLVACK